MYGFIAKSVAVYLFITIFFTGHAIANQQVSFTHDRHNGGEWYQYAWYDHNHDIKQIQFQLSKQDLAQLPKRQTNYSAEQLMQKVQRDLLRLASRVDPKRARIDIQRKGKETGFSIRSQDQALVNLLSEELSNQQSLSINQYYKQHYFERFTTATGEQAIKADHIRYIETFSPALKPLADALYASLPSPTNTRAFINLVLSWAQSIPYNALTGRGESNGSGFYPPISVLNANLGDCDSKSVLVAAIIRNMLPNAKFTLLILPNHALLAIKINPIEGDFTINDGGEDLVVLEPTGPASLALGEIAESSRHYIQRGLVTLQTIP